MLTGFQQLAMDEISREYEKHGTAKWLCQKQALKKWKQKMFKWTYLDKIINSKKLQRIYRKTFNK